MKREEENTPNACLFRSIEYLIEGGSQGVIPNSNFKFRCFHEAFLHEMYFLFFLYLPSLRVFLGVGGIG